MDTLAFFQDTQPSDGIHYLVTISKPKKGSKKPPQIIHYPYANLEDLANGVEKHSANPAVNLYHACGSYKHDSVTVEGSKKYRVEENWDRAKAFWIDLDCGQDKFDKGEGYIDQKAAWHAIGNFCKTNDFPTPMVVNSGNGVHCYWPLTKAIPAAKWKVVATLFKQVLAHHNVLADPTCTADFARILRPVGAFNNKSDTPKPVLCKREVDAIEPGFILERLKALSSEVEIQPEVTRSYKPSINSDLLTPIVSVPKYAEEIANQCNQFRIVRDTQGDVGYEHWRHVIGTISLCEEGIELAYKWSERREETGHTSNDVDVKYNTWNAGPTVCSTFEKLNESGCDGCPHKGKVKTPLMLGCKVPEPTESVVEAEVEIAGITTVVELEVPKMPKGYSYENGVMNRFMQDKDGLLMAFPFSNTLFYPTMRIRKDTGIYWLGMRMHVGNKVRDFEIETSVLNTPSKMMDALGRYEITTTHNKDAVMHLSAYMRDSLEKLKRDTQEINTLTNFGWGPEFEYYLLGTTLYHKDGTDRQVLLGGKAKDELPKYPKPKGSSKIYGEQLIGLYAEPGYEHYQYTLSSLFGSCLIPLQGNALYNGIVLNLYGSSGRGKTTVNHAGLLAFGSTKEQTINGSPDGSTTNALFTTFAAIGSQPLLMDEVAKLKQQAFSNICYSLSTGKDKERNGTSTGKVAKEKTDSFALVLHTTANQSLHGLLASNNGDTYAEALRLIEIAMNDFAFPHQSTAEVNAAMKIMIANSGAAGAAYLRHVVMNVEAIQERLDYWAHRIAAPFPDIELRNYRSHSACTITAAEITNDLGITAWDIEALFGFNVQLFHRLITRIKAHNVVTPETALSLLLSSLQGHIIVTSEYRDLRTDKGGIQLSQVNIIGEAKARWITGVAGTKGKFDGHMYIKKRDASNWCDLDNRKLNLESIIEYCKQIGIYVPIGTPQSLFAIGRGSVGASGNAPCFCINYSKYEEMTGEGLLEAA